MRLTPSQEAAGRWEVRKWVDAGDRVARGQGRELVPSGDEEPIGAYHESVNVQSTDGLEGRIDVERVPGCQFMSFDPDGASRRFHIRHFGLGPRVIRIDDMATAQACGSRSRISSSRFVAISTASKLTPVRFPSGRLRLATRLLFTGSAPLVKTIGMVAVVFFTASAATLPPATMTVT